MSSFRVFKQRILSYRISSVAVCYCRCGEDVLHTVSQQELYWPTVGCVLLSVWCWYAAHSVTAGALLADCWLCVTVGVVLTCCTQCHSWSSIGRLLAVCYCRCGGDVLHTVSQLELCWPTVGETVKRTCAGYGTAKHQDLKQCWCVHILCCFKNRHCAQAMELSSKCLNLA